MTFLHAAIPRANHSQHQKCFDPKIFDISMHILLQQRTIFKYDQIKQLGHCSNIISFRLFVQQCVNCQCQGQVL